MMMLFWLKTGTKLKRYNFEIKVLFKCLSVSKAHALVVQNRLFHLQKLFETAPTTGWMPYSNKASLSDDQTVRTRDKYHTVDKAIRHKMSTISSADGYCRQRKLKEQWVKTSERGVFPNAFCNCIWPALLVLRQGDKN